MTRGDAPAPAREIPAGLAASLVLVTSDRSKARAAAVQGLLPALALLGLLIWAAA